MEFIPIGSVPAKERIPFARPGQEAQETRARKAAEIFARQVVRHLGPPPPNVRIAVERISDQESTIYCAFCYYDPADDEAFEYAWRCEDEAPVEWDEVARAELADDS